MNIATGAMNTLLPKLWELLVGEYKLQKGVKAEIEELENELRSMNAALRKVSQVPVDQLDELVKIWSRDVRELSYDIEDAVDTFMLQCKGHEPTKPLSFKGLIDRTTSLFKKAKTNHQIHSVIKDIMDQVKKVGERRDRYKIDDLAARPTTVTVDPRLETIYKNVTELVGIDGPNNELTKRLMEDDSSSRQHTKIISIVGFGGLGKTTLANVLLRNIKAKFDCHVFISVSLKPDILWILKNILGQLDQNMYANKIETWGEIQIINKIRELLENKSCLCVIDDVWKESDWDTIKLALQNRGSKIIITTRSKSVAEYAGGGVYELKPLSDDDSRELFYKRIFESEEDCTSELRKVTGNILRKCGGVPLAIITLSSLLASKTRTSQEWEKVNKSIGSGLGNSLDVDRMRKILSLSYYDLPCHLKTCLLSLIKYPEDRIISRDVLVWSWIAEGFVTHEGQPAGASLQDVGESYFSELINRSLIRPVNIFHLREQDGEVHACQVHDMVFELIKKLSAEEDFINTLSTDNQRAGTSSTQKKKIRRLAVHNSCNMCTSPESKHQLSQVRSLTAFGRVDTLAPLSSFRVLRALQLEGCAGLDKNHIDDLSKLRLLRFLRLSHLSINELPESIAQLESLETLDIRGSSSIIVLPMSFVNLRQLVRLIADRVKLPDGLSLRSMKSLQELVGLCVAPDALSDIGDLTELRVLKISGCISEQIVLTLQRCSKLQELATLNRKLHFAHFIQQVPSSLQRFTSIGVLRTFPEWINSSLSCLTVLSIRLFYEPVHQKHVENLARLPSLHFLRLHVVGVSDQQKYVRIRGGACAFQCLRDFHFYCPWMFLIFRPKAMPQLRRLHLDFHAGATNNFDFGLENLSSLRHVFLNSGYGNLENHPEAEAVIKEALQKNPNRPSLDIFNF